jgi:hypothetical protein
VGGNTRDGSTPFSRTRKAPANRGFSRLRGAQGRDRPGNLFGSQMGSHAHGRRYAPLLTSAGIKVRRCERRDVPEVLTLWMQARSEHASAPDRVDDVERLVADSPAALLVAERDGDIVGVLIAAWDGWRGNMYRLAVRDDCRRERIGITLTRAGEEYLRRCGATRVTALVAFEDEVAGAFWGPLAIRQIP